VPEKFIPSQLRDLYAALGLMSEEEQLALARLYAGSGFVRLVERFQKSVDTVAAYPLDLVSFNDRTMEHEMSVLGVPKPPAAIVKTNDIAAHLFGHRVHRVVNDPTLSFSYLDREVFALRHTAPDEWRPPERNIDLLLASADRFPIVGELKIAGDKPTFYALVQALMYAAELSSASQRERLVTHYRRHLQDGPLQSTTGPFLDIYVIAFMPPTTGAFRDDAFQVSSAIARKLLEEPVVNSVIRRIAYLEALAEEGHLSFVSKAFG
jgi:hypothetical protein